MAENLRTTKFRGGTSVSYKSPNGDATNLETYGALYIGSIIADSIAPTGWHISTYAEWLTLKSFLGNSAGGQLKETGTTHWITPNTGATDKYGFTALPGGSYFEYYSNSYNNFDSLGQWWTITDASNNYLYRINLQYNSDTIEISSGIKPYEYSSIRCVKD
jgi:uncharacterized protein (TIGR02145 family)